MLASTYGGNQTTTQWTDASLDALIQDLDFLGQQSEPQISFRAPQVAQDNACDVVVDSTMASSSSTRRSSLPSANINKKGPLPKADYAVDHLDLSVLDAHIQPAQVESKSVFPSKFATSFKKKYFRFDNKSLQCFPTCTRFPDVREARMMGSDHKAGGRGESFCTNPVLASALVPPGISTDALVVVGRFLAATPEVSVLPDSDAPLLQIGAIVSTIPAANAVRGLFMNESSAVDAWGRREVAWSMQPSEAWFFNMTLPRHRRNAACAAHKVPLFVFELLVMAQNAPGSFQVCSRSVSAPFEVASIRTLIREVLSYRQSGLPIGTAKRQEQDMDEEDDYAPSATSSSSRSKEAMATRRQLAAGYSNVVHRMRLAEVSRREEQNKKKIELIVELAPEVTAMPPPPPSVVPILQQARFVTPAMTMMDVIPNEPLQEISFEIPELMASDSFNLPMIDYGGMDFQSTVGFLAMNNNVDEASADDDLIP